MRILGFVVVLVLSACGTDGGGGTGGGGGSSGGGSGGGGGGGGAVACGANTCTGCCFNGTCQPGITAAACGKNGSTCAPCQTSQVCRVDQTCGVDPVATWTIQPTAASIAANNNGSAWDGDGSAPDVVVKLDCAPVSTSGWDTTTPEVQSYTPAWTTGGCTGKASDLLVGGVTFQVIDVDVVTDDTITGQLNYVFKEADFVAGQVSFQATGGLQSLTVRLTKQ